MSEEKTCFVILPIGEIESDARKRSDQVLKHVIRPAVPSAVTRLSGLMKSTSLASLQVKQSSMWSMIPWWLLI